MGDRPAPSVAFVQQVSDTSHRRRQAAPWSPPLFACLLRRLAVSHIEQLEHMNSLLSASDTAVTVFSLLLPGLRQAAGNTTYCRALHLPTCLPNNWLAQLTQPGPIPAPPPLHIARECHPHPLPNCDCKSGSVGVALLALILFQVPSVQHCCSCTSPCTSGTSRLPPWKMPSTSPSASMHWCGSGMVKLSSSEDRMRSHTHTSCLSGSPLHPPASFPQHHIPTASKISSLQDGRSGHSGAVDACHPLQSVVVKLVEGAAPGVSWPQIPMGIILA